MNPMPSEQKSIRKLDKAEISFAMEECISGMHACTVLISCVIGCAAFIHWAAVETRIIKTGDVRSHHSHAFSRIAIKQKSSKVLARYLSCLSERSLSHSGLCLAYVMRIFSSRIGKPLQSVSDFKRIFRSIIAIHVVCLIEFSKTGVGPDRSRKGLEI